MHFADDQQGYDKGGQAAGDGKGHAIHRQGGALIVILGQFGRQGEIRHGDHGVEGII